LIFINDKPYRTGFLKAFWGRLDDKNPRLSRLQAKRENILGLSRDLYHYTSLTGLKGIIEENGFWASDNRFMNDAEENWNGINLVRKILRHKGKRSSRPFTAILLKVDELVASPSQHGHLVACFSTARDDLGQWRGYGAGGVCLRLGAPIDSESESPLFFGPDHLPFKAIYKDIRKCMLILSILRSFEAEYAIDRVAMGTHWPDDHDENYAAQLYSKLAGCILGFKDQAFQNEAEARIVLSYQRVSQYEGGLKFRVSPLGIIPYLRTGDNLAIKKHGGRLPLREIIVGPGPHQALVAQSVETFLRQRGYNNTTISLSTVPYRTY